MTDDAQEFVARREDVVGARTLAEKVPIDCVALVRKDGEVLGSIGSHRFVRVRPLAFETQAFVGLLPFGVLIVGEHGGGPSVRGVHLTDIVRWSIGFASPVNIDSMSTALAARYTLALVTFSSSASMS